MEAETKPARTCPACGSDRYQFRFRKTVEADEGKVAETKYKCKACAREWKVRVPTG